MKYAKPLSRWILGGLACLFLFGGAASAASVFSDIPQDSLFSPHIERFADQYFLTADMTGRFRPEDPINRAEFTKVAVMVRLAEQYGESENWQGMNELDLTETVNDKLQFYYNCSGNVCSRIGGKPFADVPEKEWGCEKNDACDPWYSQFVYFGLYKGFARELEVAGEDYYFYPLYSLSRVEALGMVLANDTRISPYSDSRFAELSARANSRSSYYPKCLAGGENIIRANNGGDTEEANRLLEYALLADRLDLFGNECQLFNEQGLLSPESRAHYLQYSMSRKEAPRYLALAMDYEPLAVDPDDDDTVNNGSENQGSPSSDPNYRPPVYDGPTYGDDDDDDDGYDSGSYGDDDGDSGDPYTYTGPGQGTTGSETGSGKEYVIPYGDYTVPSSPYSPSVSDPEDYTAPPSPYASTSNRSACIRRTTTACPTPTSSACSSLMAGLSVRTIGEVEFGRQPLGHATALWQKVSTGGGSYFVPLTDVDYDCNTGSSRSGNTGSTSIGANTGQGNVVPAYTPLFQNKVQEVYGHTTLDGTEVYGHSYSPNTPISNTGKEENWLKKGWNNIKKANQLYTDLQRNIANTVDSYLTKGEDWVVDKVKPVTSYIQKSGRAIDSFITNNSYIPKVAKQKYWQGKGVLFTAGNTISDVYSMVRHPVQTIEGIAYSVSHPIQTGKAIYQAGKGFVNESMSSEEKFYENQGRLAGEIALAVIGVAEIKAVQNTAKISKLTKLNKVNRVNKIAKLNKANKLIKISPYKLKPTEIYSKSHLPKVQRQMESIGKFSKKHPVRYYEYKSEKYIVDGHHRTQAAKNLGWDVYAKKADSNYFKQRWKVTSQDFVKKIEDFKKNPIDWSKEFGLKRVKSTASTVKKTYTQAKTRLSSTWSGLKSIFKNKKGSVKIGSNKEISNQRTWQSAGIKYGEAKRIQNAADRIQKPINVVGSRASGKAGAMSDWDYVVEGMTSKDRSKIKNSLPKGDGGGELTGKGWSGIDLFKNALDKSKPHIPFWPSKK